MEDAKRQKEERDAQIRRLRANPVIDAIMGEALERMEAEDYLASGGKFRPDGFDIRDPKVRKNLIERMHEDFEDFQVNPVPEEIAEAITELPMDWQDRRECYDRAEWICQQADRLLNLPKHLYASLNERKELWVRWDEISR